MSEARHTPGPWHRNIRSNGKYPVVFSGRNNHIATTSQQSDSEETEANIDLISSAPELLEILERIMKPSPHYSATQDWRDEIELVRGIANAAIAKARGEVK